jgi:hypothetical protein
VQVIASVVDTRANKLGVNKMRNIIHLVCLIPQLAFGLERVQLNQLLAATARDSGTAYLEGRQAIFNLPSDSLPLLLQATIDPNLSWQQRLVARICYERITFSEEIEKLRKFDWSTHPQYEKKWEANILGAGFHMGEIVVPEMRRRGLWYYYIEMNWKDTREYSLMFSPAGSLKDIWAGWSFAALESRPERIYLMKAIIDKLQKDETLSERINRDLYLFLIKARDADAVQVLLSRLDAFIKRTRPSSLTADEFEKAVGWELEKNILPIADSRHADLIEQFLDERPALTSLKNKLPEIRKRAPISSPAEPPFRLNHQAPIASY